MHLNHGMKYTLILILYFIGLTDFEISLTHYTSELGLSQGLNSIDASKKQNGLGSNMKHSQVYSFINKPLSILKKES